ncbi:MAG: arsenic efflux protein [Muribaculaceae bacterium]|nr:arsenic efflux protein [Muribaculaceae bacterium]
MEELLNHIQEVLGVPEFLIGQCNFLPEFVKSSLITSINFIPWLYILYFGIELLERFFMKNIHLLVKFMKMFGPIFGVGISVIPECGYQVIAATFYSRRMITRGTLLAYFISCSDDALPLLFMDLSKAAVIIPIIVIKIIAGIVVAYTVDILFALSNRITENINAINTDLNEPACCHHRISTIENLPYWWMHPLTHTFNMFMFTLLSLLFIESAINGFGGVENLAAFLMIDSPISVIGLAVLGMVPNCVVSIFIALLYLKGLISFPALLAGLVTVTGLGLSTLAKRQQNSTDNTLISGILLVTGIVTGLIVYYNMPFVEAIKSMFVG